MAFIYEVNGQRVEFEREPTERDIDEAASQLRLKPQSNMPKPVEGEGGAAFGVYRQAGRRPESQQDREASKDMALQTLRGAASNIPMALSSPISVPSTAINMIANAPRTAQNIYNRYQSVQSQLAGNPQQQLPELPEYNKVAPYDLGYFANLTPGPEPTSPAGQLAFAGGQALGTPLGAKAANIGIQGIKAIPGAIEGVKSIAPGLKEGFQNPEWKAGPNTAFAKVEPSGYYPTENVKPFMEANPQQQVGMLPSLEASKQPPQAMFNTLGESLAGAIGPKSGGQNLIPYEGQTMQAFGEQVGRDIANQGWKTAGLPSLIGGGIGLAMGGPLGAMAGAGLGAAANPMLRAAELATLNKLSKTAGFVKGFPEQLSTAQQTLAQGGRQAIQPSQQLSLPAPVAPQIPVAKPVAPTMFVGPEGQAGTNLNQVTQAGLQQKYAPQPVKPVEVSQPVATEQPPTPVKTEGPVVPEIPATTNPLSTKKQELLTQNPELYRYNRSYVVPEKNQMAIDDFLSGKDNRVIAHGGPGTGKSSLAGEWVARNPNGKVEFISSQTTMKELKNIEKNLPLSDKTLLVVDEADKLSPTISKYVTENLSISPNSQTLYTTNELGKVGKNITNTSKQIDFNYKLTPEQKLVHGLHLAEQYGVTKSLPEIEQITKNAQSFRDINRNILEGQMLKLPPLFVEHDINNTQFTGKVRQTLDDLINNRSMKNVVIIDSSVYKADPAFGQKLNQLIQQSPLDSNVTTNLVTSKASSPTFRIEVQDKADANRLSALKGNIEKSNNTTTPTNLIVEDRFGNLDPAIKSRANIITAEDLGITETPKSTQIPPKNVSQMLTGETPNASTLNESISAKKQFNEDSQKYRYGSPKNPLTQEEYNHIQNTDYIKNQDMFDRLKGIKPEYTEHSFWYKDKNGTMTNVHTNEDAITVNKIDKQNPDKEISYSRDNFDKADEWTFVKSEWEHGHEKVLERFDIKGKEIPTSHPKLKDWPEEFSRSK